MPCTGDLASDPHVQCHRQRITQCRSASRQPEPALAASIGPNESCWKGRLELVGFTSVYHMRWHQVIGVGALMDSSTREQSTMCLSTSGCHRGISPRAMVPEAPCCSSNAAAVAVTEKLPHHSQEKS